MMYAKPEEMKEHLEALRLMKKMSRKEANLLNHKISTNDRTLDLPNISAIPKEGSKLEGEEKMEERKKEDGGMREEREGRKEEGGLLKKEKSGYFFLTEDLEGRECSQPAKHEKSLGLSSILESRIFLKVFLCVQQADPLYGDGPQVYINLK